METVKDFLIQHSLFEALPGDFLGELAEIAEVKTFPKGTVLNGKDFLGKIAIVSWGRLFLCQQDETDLLVSIGDLFSKDLIGELSLFLEKEEKLLAFAVRETELIFFPSKQFLDLLQPYQAILSKIMKSLLTKTELALEEKKKKQKIFTFAIVPIGNEKKFQDFLMRWKNDLQKKKTVGCVKKEDLKGFSLLEQRSFLQKQEEAYDLLILEGESHPSEWNQLCLQRADRVLFFIDPDSGQEKLLQGFLKMFPEKGLQEFFYEMVFFHSKMTRVFDVRRWIFSESPIHHVALSDSSSVEKFFRMMRGESIGLVLSGGGARALAHIGALRAFKEKNIPIDAIGGTSLGAFFAALYALDLDIEAVSREIFLNLKSYLDGTFPFLSLIKGKKIEKFFQKIFGETRIEDLHISYFCLSSHFETLEPFVHSQGKLSKALLASTALPGILPPVLDEKKFFIDGSFSNIFPLDVMKNFLEEGFLIGVDVEHFEEPLIKEPFPPFLSGWKLLIDKCFSKKFLSLEKKNFPPSMFSILLDTAFLHSASQKQEILSLNLADLVIQPPVRTIRNFDFKSFDQIVEIGYQEAFKVCEKLP